LKTAHTQPVRVFSSDRGSPASAVGYSYEAEKIFCNKNGKVTRVHIGSTCRPTSPRASSGSRIVIQDEPARQANEDCEFCHVLYRDDGVPLGCVLRLHDGDSAYAYTITSALRRLGACSSDDAARGAVEHAVGTERTRCCGEGN
jgi:hypothetical protein